MNGQANWGLACGMCLTYAEEAWNATTLSLCTKLCGVPGCVVAFLLLLCTYDNSTQGKTHCTLSTSRPLRVSVFVLFHWPLAAIPLCLAYSGAVNHCLNLLRVHSNNCNGQSAQACPTCCHTCIPALPWTRPSLLYVVCY